MARQEICVEKVSPKYTHTNNHHVDYYLYKTNKTGIRMPKGTPGKHCTGVCFSGLHRYYKEKEPRPNRLLYVMHDDEHNLKLTLKEKREFVKLSRKHNLLPKHFKYEWVSKDSVSRIVLDITNASPSLIYGYLCNFRYIREDPGFVRALVYLVKTKKMDFYVAYVLASRVCLSHSGHTVIEPVRAYMEKKGDPNNVELSVARMAGVYRYFKDPKKYDKRTLKSVDGWDNFNCQISIAKACTVGFKINSSKAFSAKLAEVIRLSDAKIRGASKTVGEN